MYNKIFYKKLLEGWRNHLFPPEKIRELIEKTSAERMTICDACPFQSSNAVEFSGYKTIRPDEHCIECGCTLAAKTKCLSCSCPINKWQALLDEAEDRALNEAYGEIH